MRFLALIAPLVLAAAAQAGPGFWTVGFAPGTNRSEVRGLSGDGFTAVGSSYGTFPIAPGFSWTVAGGRNDFGLQQGMPITTMAMAISDVGTLVGEKHTGDPMVRHAYRWTGSGPLEDLGLLPGRVRSYAEGVSGDGSIVVGTCEASELSNAYGEAFYWTPQSGMKGLGYLKQGGSFSKAEGISRDGATIVGMSQSGGILGDFEAFTWTQAKGMKVLPGLPGESSIENFALAVNADGTIAVGTGNGPDERNHALRWVNGAVEDLSPGFAHQAFARAVSDDGAVVAGEYGLSNSDVAFVWTSGTGLIDLKDYLAIHGLDVPADYLLEQVHSTSGDGLTFGGIARNLVTKQREGFVATIPAACDADCDSSGELDIDDFICFQTLFGLGGAKADCDSSGELDIDDFICFQTAFGLGCP